MRDEEQRARPRLERLLELFDRGQVEVVGRLVEHEAVRAPSHEQGELRACALTGRQRGARALDVVRAEAELGQQRPGLLREDAGRAR